jgi:hypothetical protein
MDQMHEATGTSEVIHADVPPEPPIGSVVLDREHVAWQAFARNGARRWVQAGTVLPLLSMTPVEGMKPWHRLLVEHGPVTLVYRGE